MSDGQTRLAAALLDAPCRVTARFNRRVDVHEWPAEKFSLKTNNGEAVAIRSVEAEHPRHDQTTTFAIETAEPLDFVRQLYDLWVEGAGSRLMLVRGVLLDPQRFYDDDARLGATWTPEHTTFRVFAPTAAAVHVAVADELTGDAGLALHEMHRNDKAVWEATVPGNLEGKYYAYRLTGIGYNPASDIPDIYATCTQDRAGRCLIVNLAATDPPGFREQQYTLPASPVDTVIYEMHVRDFTIAASSGAANRGKFLGLGESGTHLPGDPDVKTGLDHLVEMGITHVQLMPVQDFDNDETRADRYDWGYMPLQFNSPDGAYASSVTGPARVRELKQAIMAFHERGIGVILDVVYNHTAKAAPFERLVPNYYYRKTPTGNFCNGSGCGNEFMSESPMGRKFILDSLKMWAQEYRIDGFRFDLMGLTDVETMKQIRAELSALRGDLLLLGEPWAAGPTPLKPVTDKMQIRGTGIAAFNDGFRDALKGDRDGGPPGFVQTGDRVAGVRLGLAGAVHDWAIDPTDTVNYIECHDNLTAWDKLLQSAADASEEGLQRMARFAGLILFASQGSIFLHAGQEFLRSKRGHHNSYNLPDVINQVDWAMKKRHADVCAYYRGLIAVRKAHPGLRLRTRAEVEYRVWFGDAPHSDCLAYIVHTADMPRDQEPARAIVVLLNGHREPVTFALGEGTWTVHADADRANVEPLRQVEKSVELPAYSGVFLCRYE